MKHFAAVRTCAFGKASAPGRARARTCTAEIAESLARLSGWLDGVGDDPGGWGFEALSPARSRTSRHGAIMLPFQALLAAVEDAGA